MDYTRYEHRVFPNPKLPIISQYNGLGVDGEILMHWHESIEILRFREGETQIGYNTDTFMAAPGDICVVNSCALHSFKTISQYSLYDCIIISKEFLEKFGIPVSDVQFNGLINDQEMQDCFEVIKREMAEQKDYYEISVKVQVVALMTRLLRSFSIPLDQVEENRSTLINMVKSAILYIQQHFTEPITVDDICKSIGFSKYYFCRSFHDITGKTVVETINLSRCNYARDLLASKKYNVSECARMSGFSNLSYFAKTYKYHMGTSPSEALKKDTHKFLKNNTKPD